MRDGVIHLNIEDVPPPVPMNDEELDEYIMGVILIHQYNLKKGIELFRDKAEDVVMKELQQIHDMDVYVPMDPKELSYEKSESTVSIVIHH